VCCFSISTICFNPLIRGTVQLFDKHDLDLIRRTVQLFDKHDLDLIDHDLDLKFSDN